MGIVVVSHSEILPHTPWNDHCHNKAILKLEYGEIVIQFLNLCAFSCLLIWVLMPHATMHMRSSKGGLWHQHSASTMLETECLVLELALPRSTGPWDSIGSLKVWCLLSLPDWRKFWGLELTLVWQVLYPWFVSPALQFWNWNSVTAYRKV